MKKDNDYGVETLEIEATRLKSILRQIEANIQCKMTFIPAYKTSFELNLNKLAEVEATIKRLTTKPDKKKVVVLASDMTTGGFSVICYFCKRPMLLDKNESTDNRQFYKCNTCISKTELKRKEG